MKNRSDKLRLTLITAVIVFLFSPFSVEGQGRSAKSLFPNVSPGNHIFLVKTKLITEGDETEKPVVLNLLIQKGKTKVHKKIESTQGKGEYVACLRDKNDNVLARYYFQYPKIRTIPPAPPESAIKQGRDVLKINNPQVTLTIPYHEDTASITLSRADEENNILDGMSIDKASRKDSNNTDSSPSSGSTRNNVPSPPPSPNDKFNLLIMSSGYSQEEMTGFDDRAQEIKNTLLSTEPFTEYSYGIDINIYHNTDVLDCDCGYAGISRLMNCDSYKIVSAAAASGNFYDEIIIIHNTATYCGGGFRDYGSYQSNSYSTYAMVYDGPDSSSMALHEFGHSLANLCDEYSYGSLPYTYYDCVNCRENCNDWAALNPQCSMGCDAEPQYYRPESSIMYVLSNRKYNQASVENGIVPILQYFIPQHSPPAPPSIKNVTIQ